MGLMYLLFRCVSRASVSVSVVFHEKL
jgi:hypothetical protein